MYLTHWPWQPHVPWSLTTAISSTSLTEHDISSTSLTDLDNLMYLAHWHRQARLQRSLTLTISCISLIDIDNLMYRADRPRQFHEPCTLTSAISSTTLTDLDNLMYLAHWPRQFRLPRSLTSLGVRTVWSESSLCAHWVAKYPSQRRLWSDWADAQADLSLRWAHSHFLLVLSCRGSIYKNEGGPRNADNDPVYKTTLDWTKSLAYHSPGLIWLCKRSPAFGPVRTRAGPDHGPIEYGTKSGYVNAHCPSDETKYRTFQNTHVCAICLLHVDYWIINQLANWFIDWSNDRIRRSIWLIIYYLLFNQSLECFIDGSPMDRLIYRFLVYSLIEIDWMIDWSIDCLVKSVVLIYLIWWSLHWLFIDLYVSWKLWINYYWKNKLDFVNITVQQSTCFHWKCKYICNKYLIKKTKPEDDWSCIAHLSADGMLKSAVTEEQKIKNIESEWFGPRSLNDLDLCYS